MENFWKDIIVGGGQIGGLICVVGFFLKHLTQRDERFERISGKMWECLTKNTTSTDALTKEIAEFRKDIKNVKQSME